MGRRHSIYTYIGNEIPEDQYLLASLTHYYDQVEAKLSKVIGVATNLFDDEKIRLNEAALGNLVSDAMLWVTRGQGADCHTERRRYPGGYSRRSY